MTGTGSLWNEIINFLFPSRGLCLICWKEYQGVPERQICPHCVERLLDYSRPGQVCPLCGRFTTAYTCPNCHGQGIPAVTGVLSVVPYDGQYRELIQNLKYGGNQDLSKPLGYLMGCRWRKLQNNTNPDVIVPVPLAPHRHLERGFNQSALLGRAVSNYLRKPLVEDYLLRGEGKASQTTLGRAERTTNTQDIFRRGTAGELNGQTVILVDDIVTTGATLAACAKVLRALGAKTICGLTWAAGIRHNMAKERNEAKIYEYDQFQR